jgi:hypothetical protein
MDDLEVVRKAIEEHHKVRSNIRLVGEAMNDMEAVFGLQQANADWSQGSVQGLSETVDRMQRTINGLSAGLKNHFGFEELYLPPVFGDNLMKALLMEHGDVRQKLDACAGSIVADVRGLPQGKLLSYRSVVQRLVAELGNAIENHTSREEIILKMLERALDKEKQGGTRQS